MTKEELRQIRHLKREIILIKDQIEDLKAVLVMDKVRGSQPEWPYIEHDITIKGLAGRDLRQVATLKERLERRVDDLVTMVLKINKFVETIDDSLLRQVITLRHVQGLTWDQVAEKIGGNTADSCRKMHDRYLEGKGG